MNFIVRVWVNTCKLSMSSFKKREKLLQRTHRERSQPHSRKNLGLLEKHKDYVVRAKSYRRKKDALKLLHEKARNRNPDEFYYRMVNTGLKEGMHVEEQPEEQLTEDQLMLMKTRDLKYVQMKVTSEERKVERLKESLHLTDQAGKNNTHIYFTDSEDEADDTTLAQTKSKHLSEQEELLVGGAGSSGYRELNQRLNRVQELKRMRQKMETKKKLVSKERHVRIPGSDGIPVTYKWFTERKK